MATISSPKDKGRVMSKILALIFDGNTEADRPVGANNTQRATGRVWLADDDPSGEAAPTGMLADDLILDYTNDKVYRYVSATSYTHINSDGD